MDARSVASRARNARRADSCSSLLTPVRPYGRANDKDGLDAITHSLRGQASYTSNEREQTWLSSAVPGEFPGVSPVQLPDTPPGIFVHFDIRHRSDAPLWLNRRQAAWPLDLGCDRHSIESRSRVVATRSRCSRTALQDKMRAWNSPVCLRTTTEVAVSSRRLALWVASTNRLRSPDRLRQCAADSVPRSSCGVKPAWARPR